MVFNLYPRITRGPMIVRIMVLFELIEILILMLKVIGNRLNRWKKNRIKRLPDLIMKHDNVFAKNYWAVN